MADAGSPQRILHPVGDFPGNEVDIGIRLDPLQELEGLADHLATGSMTADHPQKAPAVLPSADANMP